MTTDAELAVLGGLLIQSSRYDDVAWLRESDFSPKYRPVWRWIEALCSEGESVNAELAEAQGYPGRELMLQGSAANIVHFAKQLRDASLQRRLREAATETLEDRGSASELIDRAETRIAALREEHSPGIARIKSHMPAFVDHVSELHEAGGEIAGHGTGLIDLDRMTGGFREGQQIVLAGRSSMGKTAFGLLIAEYFSRDSAVAFFSQEMLVNELLGRWCSGVGHVPLHKIRNPGVMEEGDWPVFSDAMAKLAQRDLWVNDTAGLTVNDVRALARQAHRQTPLGLVVVDYIGLMRPVRRNDRRDLELKEISFGLKSLAKELKCPVLSLSQLNRECDKRPDKRPRMSDLRDSGDIEQDADLILFVYRDEYYYEDSPHKGVAEIIIGKQRNGPTGTVETAWLGEYAWFANYEGPTKAEREPQDKPFQQRYRRSA